MRSPGVIDQWCTMVLPCMRSMSTTSEPATSLKVWRSVYQPDVSMQNGSLPKLYGVAPLRNAFVLAAITKPPLGHRPHVLPGQAESTVHTPFAFAPATQRPPIPVPTLNTKSRRNEPVLSL